MQRGCGINIACLNSCCEAFSFVGGRQTWSNAVVGCDCILNGYFLVAESQPLNIFEGIYAIGSVGSEVSNGVVTIAIPIDDVIVFAAWIDGGVIIIAPIEQVIASATD